MQFRRLSAGLYRSRDATPQTTIEHRADGWAIIRNGVTVATYGTLRTAKAMAPIKHV